MRKGFGQRGGGFSENGKCNYQMPFFVLFLKIPISKILMVLHEICVGISCKFAV